MAANISIVDELKLLAGWAPKKVEPEPVAVIAPLPPPAPVKSKTIDEIAAEVQPPFEVVRVGGRVHADDVRMTLKCPRKHIHRYFISTVAAGTYTCRTCKCNKQVGAVRDILEQQFGLPFIRTRGETREFGGEETAETISHEHDFVNDFLKLAVDFADAKGFEKTAKYLIVRIKPTVSAKKLCKDIIAAINAHPDALPAEAADAVARVRATAGEKLKKRAKAPLPYTAEHAKLVLSQFDESKPGALMAELNMNIVGGVDAKSLCIESVTSGTYAGNA